MAGWRATTWYSCTGCSVIENGTAFGSHLLLFRHVGQCGCTLYVVGCSHLIMTGGNCVIYLISIQVWTPASRTPGGLILKPLYKTNTLDDAIYIYIYSNHMHQMVMHSSPPPLPPIASLIHSSASMCRSLLAGWWIGSITLSQLLSECIWHARVYFTRAQRYRRHVHVWRAVCAQREGDSGHWGWKHCRVTEDCLSICPFMLVCLYQHWFLHCGGSGVIVAAGHIQ